MSDALQKKVLFERALRDAKLSDLFEVIEVDDFYAFKTVQNIKNGRALLLVILDDSVYTTASITFAYLDDLGKKEKVLRLFNEMNHEYKNKKFYITEKNELVCQMVYTALSNDFNADIFLKAFISVFQSLEEDDYPKVMRVLWS